MAVLKYLSAICRFRPCMLPINGQRSTIRRPFTSQIKTPSAASQVRWLHRKISLGDYRVLIWMSRRWSFLPRMVFRSISWWPSVVQYSHSCRFWCNWQGFFWGTNNFTGNVILKDMQLPSDNPEGGIDFVAVTQLNNTRYSYSSI